MLKVIAVIGIFLAVSTANPVSSPFITGAEPGQFPFLAYLVGELTWSFQTYIFTGALISQRHILTKGSFLDKVYEVDVYLGAHNTNDLKAEGVLHIPRGRTIELVKTDLEGEDIAFVKLRYEWVTFTDKIQPIAVPKRSDEGLDYVGLSARVVYWIERVAPTSNRVPVYDDVTIAGNAACNFPKERESICVPENLVGPAGGNSGNGGAPLIMDSPDGPYLIGLFSVESKTEKNETTNVFIRLNAVLDYIDYVLEFYP